jgi:hypothetical protein
VTPPRGASDAFLMPYHVERGKIMVRERFALVPFVDEERIAAAIELTRFPVPDDEDHAATDTEAALVRAGDLVGQLGDPLWAVVLPFANLGGDPTGSPTTTVRQARIMAATAACGTACPASATASLTDRH